jgi:hypothetical protein
MNISYSYYYSYYYYGSKYHYNSYPRNLRPDPKACGLTRWTPRASPGVQPVGSGGGRRPSGDAGDRRPDPTGWTAARSAACRDGRPGSAATYYFPILPFFIVIRRRRRATLIKMFINSCIFRWAIARWKAMRNHFSMFILACWSHILFAPHTFVS